MPTGVLQMASQPSCAQLGIRGCWCQGYLVWTVHAKVTDGCVWSGQNRDTNPSNRQGVGLRVHVCTRLLACYLHKRKPQDTARIPRGDVAASSLAAGDQRLPDSGWQMVRCHYWDQGLYPRVFRDRVNPQECPSHSDERKVLAVPKAEVDLQMAYRKMGESGGSDRGIQDHG